MLIDMGSSFLSPLSFFGWEGMIDLILDGRIWIGFRHEAQKCYCDEPSCVGFIGGKTQTDIGGMDDLYLDGEFLFFLLRSLFGVFD